MGTRNLTMVVKGGDYKVAQYCQWDGYPSGQGATVLTFLRDEMDRGRFEAAVAAAREISEEDLKALWKECGADRDDGFVTMEVANEFKKRYPWLHRDCGADVLKIIQDCGGDIALNLALAFVKDSLFCEWAYVVDLDANVLEVYEGFNTKPLAESDRFFSEESPRNEYWPIRLAKSYPLDALPTDDEFQADLAQDEEEEETAETGVKHTAEPWVDRRIGREGDGSARSQHEQLCNDQGVGVFMLEHDGSDEANANIERAMACVNAMAEIEHPGQLRVALELAAKAWRSGEADGHDELGDILRAAGLA